MESLGAVETLLTRVRDWWRRRNELGGLDDKELQRVAAELGMSTNTLEDLVQRGPDAAHNLYERMRALGLSKADVEAAAQGVLRDLQRTCACCNEKSICERDLAERPEASGLEELLSQRRHAGSTRKAQSTRVRLMRVTAIIRGGRP